MFSGEEHLSIYLGVYSIKYMPFSSQVAKVPQLIEDLNQCETDEDKTRRPGEPEGTPLSKA